jgi:xanthine/uracil permease
MSALFSSIQWAIFILAGSIVAPLSIGAAFHLPAQEIAALIQRTFFVIGIGTLLQVYFGHRLQISEGPAGLWWGVFLLFAGFASSMNLDTYEVLRNLEAGLLISGICFFILSGLKIIHKVKQIFTPLVTGTYLFLLIAQLSSSVIKGIFGIGYLKPGVDLKVTFLAILTLIFAVILAQSPYPKLRNFSVLYAIGFGWVLFAIFGVANRLNIQGIQWFSVPEIFVWGLPKFDFGIVLTSVFTSLLLLSNLIASMEVVDRVVEQKEKLNYNRAGFIMGCNQMLSAVFSTVGFVPVSLAAGFIKTTNIREKRPFIIGSALILGISFFPIITMFFASLPTPVGYAAIFLSFSSMVGLALREYASAGLTETNLLIIGISLLVGIGSMFVPAEALEELPGFLMTLLNNGLILGVLACIFIEQGILLLKRSK